MAETAPRRGERIINEDGTPTLRFLEYLENITRQVNLTEENTDISPETINNSIGIIDNL
jgi:hypothetical protein